MQRYFYCYDKQLVKYLRFDRNIQYNCTGLNVKTKDQFWQFDGSEKLFECVDTFMKLKSKSNDDEVFGD